MRSFIGIALFLIIGGTILFTVKGCTTSSRALQKIQLIESKTQVPSQVQLAVDSIRYGINSSHSETNVILSGKDEKQKIQVAQLLSRELKKDAYRIDLSMVVSKYIDETEKNIDAIFDAAEDKNWILFFDEADSLFGKRINANSDHDKYANIDTNYLLQRIESYNGISILSTNNIVNLDSLVLQRIRLKFVIGE